LISATPPFVGALRPSAAPQFILRHRGRIRILGGGGGVSNHCPYNWKNPPIRIMFAPAAGRIVREKSYRACRRIAGAGPYRGSVVSCPWSVAFPCRLKADSSPCACPASATRVR